MKTAGDILSALFDERFMKKARGYSKLFDSWTDITAKNGIAAAADHSRIKDLDRGILLVEMDHPGWKQILQTKQTKLLNDFRRRFPDMDISGISLILSTSGNAQKSDVRSEPQTPENFSTEPAALEKPVLEQVPGEISNGYDSIKDEGFKQRLKQLEQTIATREANGLSAVD